jgi:ABC-type multidrug transport system ATPase subunit
MDPTSRRAVWRVLRAAIDKTGRSFMITSHMMEECEALCTRVGIIRHGRLQCVGSPLYLKSRFGGGCRIVCSQHHPQRKKEKGKRNQKKKKEK